MIVIKSPVSYFVILLDLRRQEIQSVFEICFRSIDMVEFEENEDIVAI